LEFIMPSPEEILTALNKKLHEAGLNGTFEYDGENYHTFISTNYKDWGSADAAVKTGLSDLIAVLQIEDADIQASMRGSLTAHVSIEINAKKLQKLLEHPLPTAQALLGVTPKTDQSKIIDAFNRKLREAGLNGTFEYDGENYHTFISTNYKDWGSADAAVKTGLSDLIAVLQIEDADIQASMRGSLTAHVSIEINAKKLQKLLEHPLPTAAQLLNLATKQEQIPYQDCFKDKEGNFFIETKTVDEAKAISIKLSKPPFNIVGGDGRSPKWPGPHKYDSGLKYGVVITPTNLAGRSITNFISDLNLQKEHTPAELEQELENLFQKVCESVKGAKEAKTSSSWSQSSPLTSDCPHYILQIEQVAQFITKHPERGEALAAILQSQRFPAALKTYIENFDTVPAKLEELAEQVRTLRKKNTLS
jgi:hypothetical protein